jgi:hypothetical protein
MTLKVPFRGLGVRGQLFSEVDYNSNTYEHRE